MRTPPCSRGEYSSLFLGYCILEKFPFLKGFGKSFPTFNSTCIVLKFTMKRLYLDRETFPSQETFPSWETFPVRKLSQGGEHFSVISKSRNLSQSGNFSQIVKISQLRNLSQSGSHSELGKVSQSENHSKLGLFSVGKPFTVGKPYPGGNSCEPIPRQRNPIPYPPSPPRF